jgi:hypothetical protein
LLSRIPTATLTIGEMEPYDLALTNDGNNGFLVGYQGELAYIDLEDDFNPIVVDTIALGVSIKKVKLTSDE